MMQTIFSSIVSEDTFHRTLLPLDTYIMDLVHILVKCGKYNRNAIRTTRKENVHQTVHSSAVLMGLYSDILKKTAQLNQELVDFQFDFNLQLFPQFGIQVITVRFVYSPEKILAQNEAESMVETVATTLKKRTATLNRSSSFQRNNNDSGPHRKRRRF